MTKVSSAIEQLKEFNVLLNKFFSDVSKTTSGRIFTLIFITYFLPVVLLGTIGYLQYNYSSKSRFYSRQDDLVIYQLRLEAAQERIKLCIESEKSKDVDSEFKCDDALSAYKSLSSSWPPERRNEIVKSRSFATMGLEIKYYLSVNAVGQKNLGRKLVEKELLELIFSRLGIILLVLVRILPPGFVLYKFYSLRKVNA